MNNTKSFLKFKMTFFGHNFNSLKFEIVIFLVLAFTISSCSDKENVSDSTKNRNIVSLDHSITEAYNYVLKTEPKFILKRNNPESTDNQQFSSSCTPSNPGNGFTCSTIHIITTVSLPASTDCPACSTVNIGLDLKICQNNGTGVYSFYFYNFGVVPSGSCATWWACLGSLPAVDADRVIEEMRQQASLIIERTVVSSWVNLYAPLCPNTFYTSDFALETCYETCITPIAQDPYYDLELISCGNKCCLRTRTFCKELSGLITISSATYQTVGSSDCSNSNQCSAFSSGCYDRPCGTP